MLSLHEIYLSLQGEGVRAGRPCVLVRLAGCNLRCQWCDTTYAYAGGQTLTPSAVVEQVRSLGCPLVMVTGGEPLLQEAAPALLTALCDAGLEVLLATNGSLDISGVDGRVVRCIDCKCPASGESVSFLWSNLVALRAGDELKFVLADWADFQYARRVIVERDLRRPWVILAPVAGRLDPENLAKWLLAEKDLADRPNVRLGLQLHKIVWPGKSRGI